MVRFTFLRLWVSEADMKVATPERPASKARSKPRSLGTKAQNVAPCTPRRALSTSLASASWGIQRGRTKEVTSMSS